MRVPGQLCAGLLAEEKDGGTGLQALVAAAGGQTHALKGVFKPAANMRLLVFGTSKKVAQQLTWCQQHLPAGQAVHDRQALIDGILMQSLDAKALVLGST